MEFCHVSCCSTVQVLSKLEDWVMSQGAMSDLPSSLTLIAEEVEEISKGSKWWLRFLKITLPVKYYFQSWQNISFGKRKNAVYCSQLLEHHEKSGPSLNWFMLAVGSLQLESVLPKSHSHPSVVSFHHWQSIPLVLSSGVLEDRERWFSV